MSRDAVARAICKVRLDHCCQKYPASRCVVPDRFFNDEATAALDAIEVTEEVVEAAAQAIAAPSDKVTQNARELYWNRVLTQNERDSALRKATAALTAALAVWRR